MARPVKEGLDYFPFDVDFATNEKTEAITGEFGPKGVLIFIYLLAAIYRKGYYLEWTGLAKNQLVNRVSGATGELVGLVVKRLIEYGTFNKDLFLSDNVLTSQRIQETFTDATKRRKSQKPTLYWINADSNSASDGVNDDINTQSKVKESKVNKNKTDSQAGVRVHENARLLWQNVWGFPNAIATQDLEEWIGNFGDDLVCWVIKYAARKDVKAKGADRYLAKVFDGYTERKIKTVEQAEAESKKHEETARANYTGPQHYGKPERVDKEPDWLKPGYQEPKHEVTPEQRAKLAEQLEQLNQLGEKN
ncbi:prophage Lp1 protein 20 [Lacticaseibacillus paracasei subsp. paracasei 8700:2]|uniref:Prophage Lp1 protein 20 n=1 Tax=Lacticaseibacillus paracasei subsp. paracasei 8700:2 TaxID=537973 RepID=A0A826HV97_LACPA|nr:Lin1244/Lin1753 domain-containing protein [Lacticaseibacillus paracasei]EEQ64761.1 prophage Lp1 protein 20 [Lacticaseibacillus paracasei subsp. paracasei 8700:2]